jgi:molybdopterin molybdotransferase
MGHTTVDEHAALIRELLAGAFDGTDTVSIADALGRCLADHVVSPVDLPLFRNSQMDGFAVRASDLSAGVTLPIVGEIAAQPGTPEALTPGTAVRIMTGAVVPEGADAVVPVEDTSVTENTVSITRTRPAGAFVRERGSDILAGTRLLAAGTVIASRHIAALAAAGITSVHVRRTPRIAAVTTGAELVDPGAHPSLGQVFDANLPALVAAIEAAGGEVAYQRRVTDDAATLETALADAAIAADVIVTSGGISMGNYEVVRDVLEPLGARIGHIAMQPGGPQATGEFDGTPVLSFPGNPVSTQISFEVFLAPLIREAAGIAPAAREQHRLVRLVDSVPGKRQFLRGIRSVGGRVDVVAGPGSHLVAGLAASDVLIDIPEDVTELQEGDVVECWIL